jgi:hypothetical protein
VDAGIHVPARNLGARDGGVAGIEDRAFDHSSGLPERSGGSEGGEQTDETQARCKHGGTLLV